MYSEKKRCPAWCDRILWLIGKNAENDNIVKQINYISIMELKSSDHKPISSLFEVKIKKIDAQNYNKSYNGLIKQLDKYENDLMPILEIDKQKLVFEASMTA